MPFEDLGTWKVFARLDGAKKVAGVFAQTHPQDAAGTMLRSVRALFNVESEQWKRWSFFCSLRSNSIVRTVVFGVTARGELVRIADSRPTAG